MELRDICSYECNNDKSDDSGDERVVGKIDHAIQARTYITHKVLNDFIQKATKAEINKKIYQSRLKKNQNQQQQQQPQSPPYKPKNVQNRTYPQTQPISQAPQMIQQPPQIIQPTVSQPLFSAAPPTPVPIQIRQNQPIATRGRGRPRGAGRRNVGRGQTMVKTIPPQTTVATPIVITPTTQPVPPQDFKPRIVVDKVQELDQEVETESIELNYDTDEVASLNSESEPEEDPLPEDSEIVDETQ